MNTKRAKRFEQITNTDWIVWFHDGTWCYAKSTSRAGEHYVLTEDFQVLRRTKAQGASFGSVIKGSLATTGYWEYRLRANGENHCVYEHRLIMETYFPVDGMDGMEINHKDGDKMNNDPENLEWVTSRENMHHAKRNRLNIPNRSRLTLWEVLLVQACRDCEWSARWVAKQFGVSHGTVCAIWNGKSYKWLN